MVAHYTISGQPGSNRIVLDGQRDAPPKSFEIPTEPQGVTRITINQNAAPVVVSRDRPEPDDTDRISTKAIITTLLGAGAGAAVALAIAKGEDEKPQPMPSRTMAYRTVDGATKARDQKTLVIERRDRPRNVHDFSEPRVRTVPSSNPSQKQSSSSYRRLSDPDDSRVRLSGSRSGNTIVRTGSTKIITGPAPSRSIQASSTRERQLSKHTSSAPRSTHHSPHAPSVASSRTARTIPLPPSRAETTISDVDRDENNLDELEGTIVPDDSISQVSSNDSSSRHHRRSYEKKSSTRDSGRKDRSRRKHHHGSTTTRTTKKGSIMGIPFR